MTKNELIVIDDLVSIIMPCYNNAYCISDSINSVISQTYKNWELIIVDDYSIDNSKEIIKSYIQKEPRIKLIESNLNVGPGPSRNKAIKISRGQYIAFLDSDDLWDDNKLDIQIKLMKKNNTAFSFTSYRLMYGEKVSNTVIPVKNSVTYSDLLKVNHIGCLTVVFDLKILNKKYFMPNLKRQQDLGLWLRILQKGERAIGYDQVLATYRVNENKKMKNKFKAIYYRWKLIRKVECLSLISTIYNFIIYIVLGSIKYLRYRS